MGTIHSSKSRQNSKKIMANDDKFYKYSCLITLIAVGVCFVIAMHSYTYIGDDLSYISRWDSAVEKEGILAYPYFCATHWLDTNGRMANMLTPFFLSIIPKSIVDILMGIFICTLIYLIIYHSNHLFKHNNVKTLFSPTSVMIIAIVIFTLPWWDYLLLYDCWLNYPIAALMGLSIVAILCIGRKLSGSSIFFITIYSFLCGAMHEACGVAIAFGIAVQYFFNRYHFNHNRKIIAVSFVLGAIFVVLSPAIWHRFNHSNTDSNIFNTLIYHNFYLLILLFLIVIICTNKSKRQNLMSLLTNSNFILFFTAALISCIFSTISGIPGRSGFFTQIFSVIAIFILINTNFKFSRNRFTKFTTMIICSAVILHCCGFAFYQTITGKELKQAISEYSQSEDGIIYMDYTRDNEIPLWTLHKVIGVPDDDDLWIRFSIEKFHSDCNKKMIILPKSFNPIVTSSCDVDIKHNNFLLTTHKPNNIDTVITAEKLKLLLVDNENLKTTTSQLSKYDRYVVTPFEKDSISMYFISPLDIDPGN